METEKSTKPAVGDFVAIPAWKTDGMVIQVGTVTHGSDDAILVLVEEYPGQSAADCKWFHLEPGEYTNEGS